MTAEIDTLTARTRRLERLVRDRAARGRDVTLLRGELRDLYARLLAAWDAALGRGGE
jgi:hypothetical protein